MDDSIGQGPGSAAGNTQGSVSALTYDSAGRVDVRNSNSLKYEIGLLRAAAGSAQALPDVNIAGRGGGFRQKNGELFLISIDK